VNFNGGTDQTLGGTPTSQTFSNFSVNKAGGILSTTGGTTSLDINGNLIITAGSFTAPATITLAGISRGTLAQRLLLARAPSHLTAALAKH